MADSKKLNLNLTTPQVDMLQEAVAGIVARILQDNGLFIAASTCTITTPGTAVLIADMLVPAGQSDAASVTQITNILTGLVIEGSSFTVNTCTINDVSSGVANAEPTPGGSS